MFLMLNDIIYNNFSKIEPEYNYKQAVFGETFVEKRHYVNGAEIKIYFDDEREPVIIHKLSVDKELRDLYHEIVPNPMDDSSILRTIMAFEAMSEPIIQKLRDEVREYMTLIEEKLKI